MGRRGCRHRWFGARGTPARPTPEVSMRPSEAKQRKETVGGPGEAVHRAGVPPHGASLSAVAALKPGAEDRRAQTRGCAHPSPTPPPGHLSEKPRFRVWSPETQGRQVRRSSPSRQERDPRRSRRAHRVTGQRSQELTRGQREASHFSRAPCCAKTSKGVPTPPS